MTDIDGGTLSMSSDFGTIGFGTLEPGNSTLEEQICFTGLANNSNGTVTLSGISNVDFMYPYTRTSGLLKTHAGSTTFIISNTSGFYDELTGKADDETITGIWTFTNPNYPRMDTTTPFPTDNEQLATKAYADSLTFAGAPDASPTQKGIVEIATQTETDAKTVFGSTNAYLVNPLSNQRSTLLSDYVVDTSTSTNIIKIAPSPAISAYTTGQIFTFKAAAANLSPSVSINVNGLGQKSIVKLSGGTSPAIGDIASGQMIVIEYNGTNFQMLNPVAIAPATLTSVGSPLVSGNVVNVTPQIYAGTSFANLVGASVSITTSARRALLAVNISAETSVGSPLLHVDIAIDGTRVGDTTNGIVFSNLIAAGGNNNLSATVLSPLLSAANHQFVVQSMVDAGSARINQVSLYVVEQNITS